MLTWEYMPETSRTSVHCVTKVSDSPAPCNHMNFESTVTGDRITVLTVENCARQLMMWRSMPVSILMQSDTRVDIVQKVSDAERHLSHICWSHTTKELGSCVTFVRRSSATKLTLRSTYIDMKVWSRMFVMSAQSVYVHQLNWNVISWCTQTTKDFAVACVAKISSVQIVLNSTSRSVLMELNVIVFCEHIWNSVTTFLSLNDTVFSTFLLRLAYCTMSIPICWFV